MPLQGGAKEPDESKIGILFPSNVVKDKLGDRVTAFRRTLKENKLKHIQFPKQLYLMEAVIFAAGAVMSAALLITYDSQANAQSFYGVTYATSLLFAACVVAAYNANQTSERFAAWDDDVDHIVGNDDYETYTPIEGPREKSGNSLNRQPVALKAEIEYEVDIARYGMSAIVGVLMLFAIYNEIPDGKGDFLPGKGTAAAIFLINPACSTLCKMLVYDFQRADVTIHPSVEGGCANLFLFLLLTVVGAAGSYFVVFFDLILADTPLIGNIEFSLILGTVLYATGYITVITVRMMERDDRFKRSLWPDTFKHVLFVAADVLTLGFFVFGTLFEAYGRPFFDTRFLLYTSEVVASPPPPFPPPSPPA